jgi:hypothetical protein
MQERSHEAAEAMEALVSLLAEKLAPLVTREISSELAQVVAAVVAERVQALMEESEAGAEVMRASEAAEFLTMGQQAFSKIAPELPRSRISDSRFVYLRKDLLSWLEAKKEAPAWWRREVDSASSHAARDKPTKKGPRQRVQRLV